MFAKPLQARTRGGGGGGGAGGGGNGRRYEPFKDKEVDVKTRHRRAKNASQ